MRTFKVTLSYDGTDFSGFQRQANARSVQAELEAALAAIEGKHVTVAGAGRTDAGVHALGQVASFKLSSAIAERDLFRALNAKLPEDVRVLSAEVAAPGFNARFSARSKMYRYRISNTRVMSPFQRRFAWHISRDLDLAVDERGRARASGRARLLVLPGSAEQERANGFDASSCKGRERTTTRTMTRSDWTEEPLAGGGRLLTYEVAGHRLPEIHGARGRRHARRGRGWAADPCVASRFARFQRPRRGGSRRRPLQGCISFALITMRPLRYPFDGHVSRTAAGNHSERISR